MKERKKWPSGLIKQLASEMDCTTQYVWTVLSGYKDPNSLRAKRLKKRAAEIVKELEPAQ